MSERTGNDEVTALLGQFRAVASPLRAFLRDLHVKYQGCATARWPTTSPS